MYAVLVMRRECKLLRMGLDGRWSSDFEQEQADFLRARRATALSHHEGAMREHEARMRDVERAQDARQSWDSTYETRLKEFVARTRIENLPREPGFVRITMPSGETLQCRDSQADQLIASRFKRFEAPPPVPEATQQPPVMPTDEELLQAFATDGQTQRVLHWTARMTTQDAESDLGHIPADDAGGGPPPGFVAQILNGLATNGWMVDHVGEDRALINESAEVVRVRYLLVRS